MNSASVKPSSDGSTDPGDDTGRLLVSCSDRPGIVASVTAFLFERGANIIQSDQYTSDPVGGNFFLRVVFRLPNLVRHIEALTTDFLDTVGDRYGMQVRLTKASEPKRVIIFVSRFDHCLLDLLWRWQHGSLPIEIIAVISNHDDLRAEVEQFGVPYHHVPVTRDTKRQAEMRQWELVEAESNGSGLDFVVLARYMQVLSPELLGFLAGAGIQAINIHHSFLPAFAGARPYEQAKHRGVKLIGATAHYVTADLDEGPIIEQDVVRVTHEGSAIDLTRWGADIERAVLTRAVRWQAEDRVLLNESTTVVF